MNFTLSDSIAVLERTPAILEKMLKGLPDGWIHNNEGKNTWSPYDVL